MKSAEFFSLVELGRIHSVIVFPVSDSSGWYVMVSGDIPEHYDSWIIQAARGHYRMFSSLDTVHRFLVSHGWVGDYTFRQVQVHQVVYCV